MNILYGEQDGPQLGLVYQWFYQLIIMYNFTNDWWVKQQTVKSMDAEIDKQIALIKNTLCTKFEGWIFISQSLKV